MGGITEYRPHNPVIVFAAGPQNDFTRGFLDGIQRLQYQIENLAAAVANGQDMQARDNICYAQYLAGMAFNNASLGHVHAMAHQLGGFYDLPHGVCNAILLPHVQRFNMIAKMDRFVDIAAAMGENVDGLSDRAAAEKALDAIQTLSTDIGIPAGLDQLGVKRGGSANHGGKCSERCLRTHQSQMSQSGRCDPDLQKRLVEPDRIAKDGPERC